MTNQRRMGCGCHQGRQNRWVEPSILLLLLNVPMHGYEIMQSLPRFGFIEGQADPGIIYRTLRHLEEFGLVVSEWDTSGAGPAKRQYTITDSGKQQLQLWAETLENRRNAIDFFLMQVNELMGKDR